MEGPWEYIYTNVKLNGFRCSDGAVVSARKMWEEVSQADANHHQAKISPLIRAALGTGSISFSA